MKDIELVEPTILVGLQLVKVTGKEGLKQPLGVADGLVAAVGGGDDFEVVMGHFARRLSSLHVCHRIRPLVTSLFMSTSLRTDALSQAPVLPLATTPAAGLSSSLA